MLEGLIVEDDGEPLFRLLKLPNGGLIRELWH